MDYIRIKNNNQMKQFLKFFSSKSKTKQKILLYSESLMFWKIIGALFLLSLSLLQAQWFLNGFDFHASINRQQVGNSSKQIPYKKNRIYFDHFKMSVIWCIAPWFPAVIVYGIFSPLFGLIFNWQTPIHSSIQFQKINL